MRILAFVIKYLMLVVVILAIASYINYLRTGQFWLPTVSMSSIKSSLPSFDSVPSAPKMNTLEAPNEAVYKWRVNGEWVYGDTPPAGVDAQRVGGDN